MFISFFLYMPDTNVATALGDSVNNYKYFINKGFEPYKWNWDGTKESLYADCGPGTQYSRYCAALIQNNGWKIPDDYPFKVSY